MNPRSKCLHVRFSQGNCQKCHFCRGVPVILYDSIIQKFTTFLKNETTWLVAVPHSIGWYQDQGNEGLPQRRRKANVPEEAILLQQLTRVIKF